MEVNITDERPELDLIITEENQEFDVQISDDGQDVTVNIDDESNEVLIEISDEETPTKITIEESHGLSAYQLYLATTTANPPLSLKDWLDSLGGGSVTQYIDSQISDVINYSKLALETTEDLKNSVFDTDGYFDTKNIKPLSIEAGMISVGARSQAISTNLIFRTNVGGNANSVSGDAFKLYSQSLEKQW